MSIDINLHDKQGECFLSEANEILYGGAAGGGKSHLMRVKAIVLASQIPGIQLYLFRRQSEDILKNHFEGPGSFPDLLAPLVQSKFARIKYSPTKITFSNGSVINCSHCQLEKHKFNYQGAEIHVLMIDELTHFSESIYRYLRSRCRMSKDERIIAGVKKLEEKLGVKINLPLVLCGSNPGGVGHNWVKAMFIDNAKPYEIRRMSEDEGGMLRQYIPAKLEDNPSLDPDEYKGKLAGLGSPYLVKAMLEGSWDIVAGGMFDDVWDPEIHIVEPFPIPRTWYVNRSFDWGSSKPFSVCWWAESDGCDVRMKDGSVRHTKPGDLFLFAELYGWNGKPNEGCRMLASDVAVKIRQIEARFPFTVKPGPADSAIYTKENGNCIADDMSAQLIRWEHANKSPGTRVNGWEIMRRYLSGAIKRETAGLFVFDTCRQFIRTIPVLPRDKIKVDDIDTNSEDHIADAVRYRLLSKRSVIKVGRVRGMT